MITRFEPSHLLEPAQKGRLQWMPAIGAALIAGAVLLVTPRGSPWSSFTFFIAAVMGRNVGVLGLSLGAAYMIHLAVAIVYGLVVARVVAGLRQERAILAGGVVGVVLYVINFGIVSTLWPSLRGSEASVLFAHVVFGLIAAGAYRGLLRRRPASGDASA